MILGVRFMKEEITRILISLLGAVILIVLGILSAEYINQNWNITNECIKNIRLISAGLIAWAVFGRLYNFESFKGKTPTEKVKKAWFIVTYSAGFYGVILSIQLFSNTQT